MVEAVAAGKKASISIDHYLKGEYIRAGRDLKLNRVNPLKEGITKMARQQTPLLPVNQGACNFKEVKAASNPRTVILESQRCMTCGSRAVIKYPYDCQLCLFCERDCPVKAIYVSPERKIAPVTAWG